MTAKKSANSAAPGFDLARFRSMQFSDREADVPVPDCAVLFPEGADPVWRVRGLGGIESARIEDRASDRTRKLVEKVVQAVVARGNAEVAEQILQAAGLGKGVPEEHARRLDTFVAGTISPEGITLQDATKFADAWPIEFRIITNKIAELTGLGRIPGKATPSGEIQKFEQPST